MALITWMGGKSRLAPTIVSLIPEHGVYVEPFFGAGHVFFRKPASRAEVVNDVNGEVMNLFEVVRSDWRAFQDALRWALHSRRQFEELVRMPAAKVARMGRLARAARFFYIMRYEFRAEPRGTSWGCSYDGKRNRAIGFWNALRTVREVHERLKGVTIWSEDFEALIPRYDREGAFFYLDPPYYGQERYYSPSFGRQDHERLAALLAALQGRWLLSYNDHAEIRSLYHSFECRAVWVQRCAGNVKRARELLIANFSLPKRLPLS